jgi:hypothetical protein
MGKKKIILMRIISNFYKQMNPKATDIRKITNTFQLRCFRMRVLTHYLLNSGHARSRELSCPAINYILHLITKPVKIIRRIKSKLIRSA